MCGAECGTDLRLLISKMTLRITPPRRPQGIIAPKRLNIPKLKNRRVKQKLSDEFRDKLPPNADPDVEVGQSGTVPVTLYTLLPLTS